MAPKIVVGMSGGVDSSISMLLLKKSGWSPIGVSLKLSHWGNIDENACCTADSLDIAKNICKKLDVPYHVYDVSKEFEKEVMNYFISELKHNRTPNPCIMCNRHLKFKKLFEWAKKHKIKHIATGHYAKTVFNKKTKKYDLLLPKDNTKDQTYGLVMLPQKWIKHIIFPLGDYTKKEVYKIAEKEGFDFFLKKKQSQDLCFVSSKELSMFLKNKIGFIPGEIKDEDGNIIGKHTGLHNYTIGQKKGIGAHERYYVMGFEKNTLIVTKDVEKTKRKEILIHPYNFISDFIPKTVSVRTRHTMSMSPAKLYKKDKKIKVVFKKPELIASGQFCAFYKNKKCIGGGVIN
ncbi:tRNA 2-thiouridine(34) synthase MnmA [Candidatus Aenigmatarchaeota archaeon]